jgi:hypothetical protein
VARTRGVDPDNPITQNSSATSNRIYAPGKPPAVYINCRAE